MPMIEQCKEIVHKFNSVYGETLTDPQILLPSNKACLRLPGIDRTRNLFQEFLFVMNSLKLCKKL